MSYEIAKDIEKTGHAIDNLRVTINLGLKQGYEGFDQEKKEVLDFLTNLYVNGMEQIPFVVKDTVITYAYPDDKGMVACHEPALELVSDKSPLYAAHLSEEDWQKLVEEYAFKLAEAFKQFRVYITYTQVETKIFQQC